LKFFDILEEENANEWPPKSLILLSMAFFGKYIFERLTVLKRWNIRILKERVIPK